MHHEMPNIGSWYKDLEMDELFEVVAVDDSEGHVEVQFFGGEIEEIDIEHWYDLDLHSIPAPEDWSGPYELGREDLGLIDETIYPEDWCGPLGGLELERDY